MPRHSPRHDAKQRNRRPGRNRSRAARAELNRNETRERGDFESASVRSTTPAPIVCPRGKLGFSSEAAALERLAAIAARAEQPGRPKPVRCYQCPHCGGWHLTSQPLQERRVAPPGVVGAPRVPPPGPARGGGAGG